MVPPNLGPRDPARTWQDGAEPGLSSTPDLNGSAVAAFVLGLLGLSCLPVAGGVAAIVLGLAARAEIARDRRGQAGGGLAACGIAFGALSLLLGVVGVAVLVTLAARPSAAPHRAPVATAPPAAPTIHGAPSPGRRRALPQRARAESRDESVLTARLGTLVLVDLGGDARKLETELSEQAALAQNQGQKLVLWTSRGDCPPCDGVAAAVLDSRMQRALDQVRLVRVDVREWSVELERLGVPLETVPGFALLGADHRPVDFVHGGEWDADIAENIAPVLGAFVRGTYRTRQNPWRGRARSDETPI